MWHATLMRVFEPAEFEWESIFCAHVTRETGDFRGLSEGQSKGLLHLVIKRNHDRWMMYCVNSAEVSVADAA